MYIFLFFNFLNIITTIIVIITIAIQSTVHSASLYVLSQCLGKSQLLDLEQMKNDSIKY